MVTNWSVRLEKHQILLMVDFLRIFKMLHFSKKFRDFFEIYQHFLVKLLNALNFIWTLQAKLSRTWLVHIWRLLFYDYCILPVSMWEFKNRFGSIIFLCVFFSIIKEGRWRLVIMNNCWKSKCRVADNKAYRAVQSLYVNCKLKAEFQWLTCKKCLSYVVE